MQIRKSLRQPWLQLTVVAWKRAVTFLRALEEASDVDPAEMARGRLDGRKMLVCIAPLLMRL